MTANGRNMSKQISVRVSDEVYLKLEEYLKEDCLTKQKFFELVIEMYLKQDLVINQKKKIPVQVQENLMCMEASLSALEYHLQIARENIERLESRETFNYNKLEELNNKFNSKIKELENEINALKTKGRGFKS